MVQDGTTHVGLDVHKDSIQVAMYGPGESDCLRPGPSSSVLSRRLLPRALPAGRGNDRRHAEHPQLRTARPELRLHQVELLQRLPLTALSTAELLALDSIPLFGAHLTS